MWINLACSVRRTEGVEKAEAILLRAQTIHPKVAIFYSGAPETNKWHPAAVGSPPKSSESVTV